MLTMRARQLRSRTTNMQPSRPFLQLLTLLGCHQTRSPSTSSSRHHRSSSIICIHRVARHTTSLCRRLGNNEKLA